METYLNIHGCLAIFELLIVGYMIAKNLTSPAAALMAAPLVVLLAPLIFLLQVGHALAGKKQ